MTLDEFLNESLKDPDFKREYDALEGWYKHANGFGKFLI